MKTKIIFVICFATVLFSACASGESNKNTSNDSAAVLGNSENKTNEPKAENNLTIEQIEQALTSSKLPVYQLIIYTEENEPNNLINRPGQYTGKLSFTHKGENKEDFKNFTSTVEVFTNKEDLKKRKDYVEAVTQSASPLVQYIYEHKNAMMRLDHNIKPSEAAKYKELLESL